MRSYPECRIPTKPAGVEAACSSRRTRRISRVAKAGEPLVGGQGVQLPVRRAEHERVGRCLQPDEHADRPNRHLSLDVGSGRVPAVDRRQQLTEPVGRVVVLLHGETQWAADLGGDAPEQLDLVGDEFVVGRLISVGDQLDDAGIGAAECSCDPEHLVGPGAQGADLLTARRAVHVGARRGEPERTGADRFLAQRDIVAISSGDATASTSAPRSPIT